MDVGNIRSRSQLVNGDESGYNSLLNINKTPTFNIQTKRSTNTKASNNQQNRKVFFPSQKSDSSKISATLLSNYLLSLYLLKNTCMKFTYQDSTKLFQQDLIKTRNLETVLNKVMNQEAEISIAHLLVQHDKEVLGKIFNYKQVIEESISQEFI